MHKFWDLTVLDLYYIVFTNIGGSKLAVYSYKFYYRFENLFKD